MNPLISPDIGLTLEDFIELGDLYDLDNNGVVDIHDFNRYDHNFDGVLDHLDANPGGPLKDVIEDIQNIPMSKTDGGAGGKDQADKDYKKDTAFSNPAVSPLVIDMDGDGIELIALEGSTAQFDMDVDGFAELTGWVAADDAFLAYDVNGNGIIDDQSELFGNSDAFANGFLSLAALDSNGDGVIDQNDAVFSDLVVWQDGNGDAITDTGELTSLVDAGIASIDLGSISVDETNAGHTVSDRSTVTWDDATVIPPFLMGSACRITRLVSVSLRV